MERWMDRWGQLTDAQQSKFLSHEKIDEIAEYPLDAIRLAISQERRLDRIANELAEFGG